MVAMESDYSLISCERDKKVKTKRIAGILSLKETEYYKPAGTSEQIKIELG